MLSFHTVDKGRNLIIQPTAEHVRRKDGIKNIKRITPGRQSVDGGARSIIINTARPRSSKEITFPTKLFFFL